MIMNLKEALKTLLAAAYYVFYLRPFCRRTRRVALYYHGVTDREKDSFERQMRYLASHACAVKPSEIKTASANVPLLVAVTFDDAFLNLSKNALPVLKSCGIPAAICAPSAYLGKTPGWEMDEGCDDRDEPLMDVRELKRVSDEGFEIFSHTKTHPRLTSLDDRELAEELTESKAALEDTIGIPVSAISYPHGACDDRVRDAADRAGYGMGFTITPDMVGETAEDLRIGRTLVLPMDGSFVFMLKLNGAFSVLTRLKGLCGSRSRVSAN